MSSLHPHQSRTPRSPFKDTGPVCLSVCLSVFLPTEGGGTGTFRGLEYEPLTRVDFSKAIINSPGHSGGPTLFNISFRSSSDPQFVPYGQNATHSHQKS